MYDEESNSGNLQSEPEIGAIKGEETYIGKGAWINTISYENLLREKESSKLVTGMARSIWGLKPLSETMCAQTNQHTSQRINP